MPPNEYKTFKWLVQNLGFEPTDDQHKLLEKLEGFIHSGQPARLFLIKGYAGTGKTTVIKSLVSTMRLLKIPTVLLAPTGRAAKVMSNYTGKNAFTIHKVIYQIKRNAFGKVYLEVRPNKLKNALFIIDEASMISSQTEGDDLYGLRNLLDDLVEFVQSGKNCHIIFIGDVAQLPPVGMLVSEALDLKQLKKKFSFGYTDQMTLRQVMRQEQDSGVLNNATQLRQQIESGKSEIQFSLDHYNDIIRITGTDLEEALQEAYNEYGMYGVIFITRSNKRANLFNQQVRARIQFREEELDGGDLMMVVRNNYYWLADEKQSGFIANGDMIEILKVKRIYDLYDSHFAEAEIKLIDHPDETELEVKLLLNTIYSESPSLQRNDSKKLFEKVSEDYEGIKNKRERFRAIKNDQHLNALQVKFGYAVTCHKAQGGQWPCVFIDQGYLTEDMVNREYMRWLYTALTRATERVYLVNFHDRFFDKD